eukprot:scaffold45816_cov18-Prasinocladus_malaysianus.AAC.3
MATGPMGNWEADRTLKHTPLRDAPDQNAGGPLTVTTVLELEWPTGLLLSMKYATRHQDSRQCVNVLPPVDAVRFIAFSCDIFIDYRSETKSNMSDGMQP